MRDSAYKWKYGFRRKFAFVPLLVLGGGALIGLIIMEAWNHFFPVILHTAPIDFWQALWLFILAKILFGLGNGGHRGAPWMRRGMDARFEKMSPEEKERFREQMKARCGNWRDRHYWHGDWHEQPENTAKSAEDSSRPVE